MKKTILTFGTIAGIIVTAMMVFSSYQLYHNQDEFQPNAVVGYLSMLVAFSFIFIGIRNYRNNHSGGVISFGKAFKIGFFIALVATIFYVGVWLIEYYYFIPDFMDKYADFALQQAKDEGLTVVQIQAKAQEMEMYKQWYQSPILVILLTFSEILPLGIIVSLISAFILKKKTATA